MEQDSLFQIKEDIRPLADRMRPETLEEYVGQHQLVEKGKLLWQMIEDNCRGKRTYTPLFNASLRPLLDQLSAALHSMDEHERNACIYAYMRGEEVSVLSDELKRRQKNRSHQECRQRYESVLRQLEEGGVKRKKQRKAYTVIDRIVLHPLLAYPLSVKTLPHRNVITFFVFFTMLFNGGLVALVISFILNLHQDKEEKVVREKQRKADRAEAEKARAEAIDATVHEEASKADNADGD